MVKLYDRTLKLLRNLAAIDIDSCEGCPGFVKFESLVKESRSITSEIDKIS